MEMRQGLDILNKRGENPMSKVVIGVIAALLIANTPARAESREDFIRDHAIRVDELTNWPEAAGFMLTHLPGSPLKDQDVLALKMRVEGGSGWYCAPECGVHQFGPNPSNYSRAVDWGAYVLIDNATFEGHQGTVFIRRWSASQPLVPSGDDTPANDRRGLGLLDPSSSQ
jgi:hypothetical protein